jgi:hypothetical protein
MRLLWIIAAAGLLLVSLQHASAFTITSFASSGGSSSLSDPDDRVRMMFGLGAGPSQEVGPDLTPGMRSAAAKSVVINQGVLAPDFYYSARPRH